MMEIRKGTVSGAKPGSCEKDKCLPRLKKGLDRFMKQKSITES